MSVTSIQIETEKPTSLEIGIDGDTFFIRELEIRKEAHESREIYLGCEDIGYDDWQKLLKIFYYIVSHMIDQYEDVSFPEWTSEDEE